MHEISYMRHRKMIGILGLLLPILLYVGSITDGKIQIVDSLSAYYHTDSHDIFVGILIAIGIFLITYKGYDLLDKLITSSAGFFIIVLSLFPCYGSNVTYVFRFLTPKTISMIHGISAASAFALLGCMSYFQFPKTDKGVFIPFFKEQRNKIFRGCGITIYISLMCAWPLRGTDLFIVSEIVILWAFSVSWLVKGQAIFKGE